MGIIRNTIRIGIAGLVISSYAGKCSIDEVIQESRNYIRDVHPGIYRTLDNTVDTTVGIGETAYDGFKKTLGEAVEDVSRELEYGADHENY